MLIGTITKTFISSGIQVTSFIIAAVYLQLIIKYLEATFSLDFLNLQFIFVYNNILSLIQCLLFCKMNFKNDNFYVFLMIFSKKLI